MTPKELKKLAAACRAAGVLHYRQGEIEFTLSPTPPPKAKTSKATAPVASQGDVETDGWDKLSEEEKLYYSVGGMPISLGAEQ